MKQYLTIYIVAAIHCTYLQGAEGFKNARRGTTFAAQSAGTAAGLVIILCTASNVIV